MQAREPLVRADEDQELHALAEEPIGKVEEARQRLP